MNKNKVCLMSLFVELPVSLLVISLLGCKIPRASSPWRINFVCGHSVHVISQYGSCLSPFSTCDFSVWKLSPFWRLEF